LSVCAIALWADRSMVDRFPRTEEAPGSSPGRSIRVIMESIETRACYEDIIEEYCSRCWLYEDKNESNPQETIECEKCYEALQNGTPIEQILKRYSKNHRLPSHEHSVCDQIFRPQRTHGNFGRKYLDYAEYAKRMEKIRTE
jgi:hypothetical protein